MFETNQQNTGTQYTATVALLVAAFIFSPALLILSRPFGYVSVVVAVVGSALCIVLAWLQWTKHSQLTIPSVLTRNPKSK